MRLVLQRVKRASVSVEAKVISEIGKGILILVAIEKGDNSSTFPKLVDKLVNLRIFNDRNKKMNLSIKDIGGEFMVISQFTLAGSLKKGRRPSFDKAELPERANSLYEEFCLRLAETAVPVKKGIFAAMMDIELVNDGPVTFIIDTKP